MAKVLQEEREFYWSQAQTLQQSLTQLSVDKRQTEAELQVAALLHSCTAAQLQCSRASANTRHIARICHPPLISCLFLVVSFLFSRVLPGGDRVSG